MAGMVISRANLAALKLRIVELETANAELAAKASLLDELLHPVFAYVDQKFEDHDQQVGQFVEDMVADALDGKSL